MANRLTLTLALIVFLLTSSFTLGTSVCDQVIDINDYSEVAEFEGESNDDFLSSLILLTPVTSQRFTSEQHARTPTNLRTIYRLISFPKLPQAPPKRS